LSFINHLQDDIPIVITRKAQFVTPRFYSGNYPATETFHKTSGCWCWAIFFTFSHKLYMGSTRCSQWR